MENQKKYFARNTLCLILIAVLIACIALCSVGMATASAATDDQLPNAETRGLMTTISIRLSVGNGKVYVQAHNDFTLGPSTIKVYVYLYSSLTYQEDRNQMTLQNSNYIGDLNINQTLETSAEIGGVQRYWRGRVYYQLDKKDWVSKETNTVLIGADGSIIR